MPVPAFRYEGIWGNVIPAKAGIQKIWIPGQARYDKNTMKQIIDISR